MVTKFYSFFVLFIITFTSFAKSNFVAQYKDGTYCISHSVEKGETLFQISRDYYLEPTVLAKYNNMPSNSKVEMNQRIDIPLTETNFFKTSSINAEYGFQAIYYLIDDESLQDLAQKFYVDKSILKGWNSSKEFIRGDMIIVGWLKYSKGNMNPASYFNKTEKNTARVQPKITTQKSTPTIQPKKEVVKTQTATMKPENKLKDGFNSIFKKKESKPKQVTPKPTASANTKEKKSFKTIWNELVNGKDYAPNTTKKVNTPKPTTVNTNVQKTNSNPVVAKKAEPVKKVVTTQKINSENTDTKTKETSSASTVSTKEKLKKFWYELLNGKDPKPITSSPVAKTNKSNNSVKAETTTKVAKTSNTKLISPNKETIAKNANTIRPTKASTKANKSLSQDIEKQKAELRRKEEALKNELALLEQEEARKDELKKQEDAKKAAEMKKKEELKRLAKLKKEQERKEKEELALAAKKAAEEKEIAKKQQAELEAKKNEELALKAKEEAEAEEKSKVVSSEIKALNFTHTANGKAAFFFSGPIGAKFYAVTNLADKGQIIKVTNLANGKYIMAEVIGELPQSDLSKGYNIKISDNSKLPLSQKGSTFKVKINY